MSKLIIQSHRGGGYSSPENTLESFIGAWEEGLVPEADIRTTKDGVIVAFHDANFSRLVKNAPASIKDKGVHDFNYEQIAAFDVGEGQRVCAMDDLFAALRERPDKELYLDLKEADLAQLANIANRYGIVQRLILAAPRETALREWISLVPKGQTLLWMAGDEETLRRRIEALRGENFAGITQLQIHVRHQQEFQPSLAFLREVAEELKPRHILFQTLPWDIDDGKILQRLLEAGVQSFASDYPQIALQALCAWYQPKVLSLEEALAAASETKALRIGREVLKTVPQLFAEQWHDKSAVIIADTNTWKVAGETVQKAFEESGQNVLSPFVFVEPPYAGMEAVEELENALKKHQAIPVAVGAGVINDITKLAAYRVGRRYMCVATANSVDGYTAYGSSITYHGLKQTFTCPAPLAVVADLDVLRQAPPDLAASGYADLHAKVPAGADWIVADALGAAPMDPMAWNIVHGKLAQSLSDPQGIAQGKMEAVALLAEGLMLSGFALQWARDSRAASGAEHLFSHIWDMQHHTHNGKAPSHGEKVGIGTLASTALYEFLLEQPFDTLDIDKCCEMWPSRDEAVRNARAILGEELAELGEREVSAKYSDADELREQLTLLKNHWPEIKAKLQDILVPFNELRARLKTVGAPYEPEQIGISRSRLRRSYYQAAQIRRRFTVLDLALRTATLDVALDHLFGENGYWPEG